MNVSKAISMLQELQEQSQPDLTSKYYTWSLL